MKTTMQELLEWHRLSMRSYSETNKMIETLFEKEKEQPMPKPITRVEVINHAKNDKPIGRLLTLYKELGDFNSVELSFQDGGKTLKIFLD